MGTAFKVPYDIAAQISKISMMIGYTQSLSDGFNSPDQPVATTPVQRLTNK